MYQLWVKDEFAETWHLTECATLDDVQDSYLEAAKQAQPTLVTRRMAVSLQVHIVENPQPPAAPEEDPEPPAPAESEEAVQHESTISGSEGDQGPGAEGNGPV